MNSILFESWFEKSLLKNCPKSALLSWTMLRFTRKKSCIKSQKKKKILAGTDFPTAVFTGIQSHWAHVERIEAKGCWLRSSIWLHFSSSECYFRRQLDIIYKKSQLPKKAVVSVLFLIKNQQYFIFKKINSSCQLFAGYTHIKTFYRSLLNLQKGLHSVLQLCVVVFLLLP